MLDFMPNAQIVGGVLRVRRGDVRTYDCAAPFPRNRTRFAVET